MGRCISQVISHLWPVSIVDISMLYMMFQRAINTYLFDAYTLSPLTMITGYSSRNFFLCCKHILFLFLVVIYICFIHLLLMLHTWKLARDGLQTWDSPSCLLPLLRSLTWLLRPRSTPKLLAPSYGTSSGVTSSVCISPSITHTWTVYATKFCQHVAANSVADIAAHCIYLVCCPCNVIVPSICLICSVLSTQSILGLCSSSHSMPSITSKALRGIIFRLVLKLWPCADH